MLPFSVTHSGLATTCEQRRVNSGCELIAFDAEKVKVFAAEVRYCEPHWHPAPELITVLTGRFAVTVGLQNLELAAGDMLYINSEDVHSLSAEEHDSSLLTVQFSLGLFDERHAVPVIDWCTQGRPLSESAREVHRCLLALLTQIIEPHAPFRRIAAIYLLLDALMQAGEPTCRAESSQHEEATIKKGLDYINQYFDQPLTLSDVAEHIGVSYSWLSRLFKRVSRYNFKEYLTLIRLDKAKMLLRDTRTAITEISHSCGFNEHKYLISAFNKYCGMTPTEYRKRFVSQQYSPDDVLSQSEYFRYIPLNHALLNRCAESSVALR